MSIFSFNPFKSAPPTIPLAAKEGLTKAREVSGSESLVSGGGVGVWWLPPKKAKSL